MKWIFISIASLFMASFAHAAAPLVTISPIMGSGTPVTVTVSSAVLTMIPSSGTALLSGRTGVYISNPSTNSAAGYLGNCTSTTFASTIRPIQFSIASAGISQNIFYLPLREDVCVWLISLNTSAALSVHYQEVKQ